MVRKLSAVRAVHFVAGVAHGSRLGGLGFSYGMHGLDIDANAAQWHHEITAISASEIPIQTNE